jgi:hypothetical protein
MSAKLVPTLLIGGYVLSTTDPYGRILGFLDRNRYFLFQVALQLYSRGLVDHVPDPLHLRKAGSAGNRTRGLWVRSQELTTRPQRRPRHSPNYGNFVISMYTAMPTEAQLSFSLPRGGPFRNYLQQLRLTVGTKWHSGKLPHTITVCRRCSFGETAR